MARNEKKSKFVIGYKAQSVLEYAFIFPMLFLLILAIFELSFMWHKFNAVEMVAREISANVSTNLSGQTLSKEKALKIINSKTAILSERPLSFSVKEYDNKKVFTSIETYKGKPYVSVIMDFSSSGVNDIVSPSVQVVSVYLLRFFSASLPNFATNEKIVIIPDNLSLSSTKILVTTEY